MNLAELYLAGIFLSFILFHTPIVYDRLNINEENLERYPDLILAFTFLGIVWPITWVIILTKAKPRINTITQ